MYYIRDNSHPSELSMLRKITTKQNKGIYNINKNPKTIIPVLVCSLKSNSNHLTGSGLFVYLTYTYTILNIIVWYITKHGFVLLGYICLCTPITFPSCLYQRNYQKLSYRRQKYVAAVL